MKVNKLLELLTMQLHNLDSFVHYSSFTEEKPTAEIPTQCATCFTKTYSRQFQSLCSDGGPSTLESKSTMTYFTLVSIRSSRPCLSSGSLHSTMSTRSISSRQDLNFTKLASLTPCSTNGSFGGGFSMPFGKAPSFSTLLT